MARTYERVGSPSLSPVLIRVRAVYYMDLPGDNLTWPGRLDRGAGRKRRSHILSKMTEFHLAARAANLATGRRARAAAGLR